MNEKALTTSKAELALKEEKGSVDALLHPLKREILLFEGNLAGTYKLADHTALLALREGERLEFRYNQSKYDKTAVQVFSSLGQVGYVPESDEVVFNRLLGAGKSLFGKVTKTDFSRAFPIVSFSIYLEDF